MGDDVAEKFLDQVLAAATIGRQHLANKIPVKQLTQEQWREHLKGINFRENLFSRINFFDSSRELILANGQILEISREIISANEGISNIS